MFKLKRIYDASEASDGYRVLVDRIGRAAFRRRMHESASG